MATDAGLVTTEDRLAAIEAKLDQLLSREVPREWYTVEEFAAAIGRSPHTVREWARYGRVRAEKWNSGRGNRPNWTIGHDELLRYRREGLLPDRRIVG